ncbi:transposase, Gram-positive bacteria [Streptococcus equinus]|uniref:T7SS effector LXG polymorphic toxin n=1 Tax=Streptococcus equinus TaxID=1335 RepID=UPI000F6BCC07|nr:T7SS effector LXG polymorphic toxin [Streptococcus equinus]VED91626.1 transposase, Gram-positive bacteria [Streptococcus equinus]VTS86094.1 transposase, Gram-positive bacteria [Streptococcus equinus]
MKIKMSEVIAQRDSLKSSISQTKSQLSSAKKKLKSAANSEALKGDVKDAIDNKINNYQVPLLTNYVNSLDVISQGYDNLISTFKSIVSENSDSAIIDTDILQQMVDKFDSPLEQLKTSSDAINKAIDDVADIVTLTKVTTDDAISEFRGAKKVLTNTIKDMGTFNNTVFTSEAGDILDEQNTQITSLSDLGSSSYTSKKAKDFYKKTAFKTEVKETKLVVSGKSRRDQLKNELAKNLYDSKYRGYMMEASLPTATLLTLRKKGGDYYEEFQKVMDSDTANATEAALTNTKYQLKNIQKGYVAMQLRQLDTTAKNGVFQIAYMHGNKYLDAFFGADKYINKRRLQKGKEYSFLESNGRDVRHGKYANAFFEDSGLLYPEVIMKGHPVNWKAVKSNLKTMTIDKGLEAMKGSATKKLTFGVSGLISDIKAFKKAKGVGKIIPGVNLAAGLFEVGVGTSTTDDIARKNGIKRGSNEYKASQVAGIGIDAAKVGVETAAATTAYSVGATVATGFVTAAGVTALAPVAAGAAVVALGIGATFATTKILSPHIEKATVTTKEIATKSIKTISDGMKSFGKTLGKVFK